jgi:hypothetical protein
MTSLGRRKFVVGVAPDEKGNTLVHVRLPGKPTDDLFDVRTIKAKDPDDAAKRYLELMTGGCAQMITRN